MAIQELLLSEIDQISGGSWNDQSCASGIWGGVIGGAIAGIPGGAPGIVFGSFGAMLGGAIAGGCFSGNTQGGRRVYTAEPDPRYVDRL